MKPALGRHILVDYSNCTQTLVDDVDRLRIEMVRAAELAGATVIQALFHRFSPQGVSGVVVIAESHLAVHTWPEHGRVAMDIFTCSPKMDPNKAIQHLASVFGTRDLQVTEISR